jgi:hypothetical protein
MQVVETTTRIKNVEQCEPGRQHGVQLTTVAAILPV